MGTKIGTYRLGKKNYYSKIINHFKWNFNKISFAYQENTISTQGIFNITNAITRPRYVIMWVLRSKKIDGTDAQIIILLFLIIII